MRRHNRDEQGILCAWKVAVADSPVRRRAGRKLRSLDRTLPIVAMSVAPEQAAALVAAGEADAFVAKPFQVDAVLPVTGS